MKLRFFVCVCATNDLLNVMLLKIEYKAIKIAAIFPLTKRNETISIVISLFSEQMNEKKTTTRQPLPLCYVHCLFFFLNIFIWKRKQMQPNKLKISMEKT